MAAATSAWAGVMLMTRLMSMARVVLFGTVLLTGVSLITGVTLLTGVTVVTGVGLVTGVVVTLESGEFQLERVRLVWGLGVLYRCKRGSNVSMATY